jgi:hypothetical protein
VGIFSITTVYYTCSYIECARELRFQLPFSEIDPDYSERLDQHLDRVSAALGGREGIWDSTQEVLGEVFSRGDGKLNNEELCRILDSRDEFRVRRSCACWTSTSTSWTPPRSTGSGPS